MSSLKQILPVSALAITLGVLGAGCAAEVEDPADQGAGDQALLTDEAQKPVEIANNGEERVGEGQQAWWGGFGFPFWGGFGRFGFPFWGGFGGFGYPFWGGFGGFGYPFFGGFGGFGGCGLGFGGCW